MGRAISKTVMIAELIKVFYLLQICCYFLFLFVFFMDWFWFFSCFLRTVFGLGIQRRIAGLHQNTAIGSTDITDMWEPLEEGLLP